MDRSVYSFVWGGCLGPSSIIGALQTDICAFEGARPSVADTKFENFVVALVQSCEAVPGKAGEGGFTEPFAIGSKGLI